MNPSIVALLLLAGCGFVSSEQMKTANEYCSPHEGVRYVIARADTDWVEVRCNDNAKVEGKVKK